MEKQNMISGKTVPLERSLPAEFLLVAYGENVFTKGGECGSFKFDETAADNVIREFTARGRDLVIDYEHQSTGTGKAPAAGWINALVKGADGLIAKVKYWTEEAAQYLKNGEYRYFSPTLFFQEGKVSAVHSVALTNHPALHRIPALAAADLPLPLNLKDSPEQEQIKYIRFRLELAEKLENELAERNAAELVVAAFHDGKLAEADREWANKFALEQPESFRSWCASAPRRIPDNQNMAERNEPENSPEENKIFRMLGLTGKHGNKRTTI